MKLNLLPQTVSKGRQVRTAVIIASLIVFATIFASVAMIVAANKDLSDAQAYVESVKPTYANALATSNRTDAIVAEGADVIRNANLAQAMIQHNDVYPRLYDDLKPYIPSFYRIISMTATPVDATTARVTLVGTLSTYQQYADVVLALMRFKDARSISRAGYNLDDVIVPNLTPQDQYGYPHKPSQPPLPEDQLSRLTYYENLPKPSGYLGIGSYGTPGPGTKGAAPHESLVTVVLTIARNLQVPSVEGTLSGAGGATAGAAAAFGPGGAQGFGGFPGAPAGVPGVPPPSAGPPAAAAASPASVPANQKADAKAAAAAGGD